MLYDNHGRIINYVRLAVTDRCNLRCFYCMPEQGIRYVNRKDLLTFEEMERVMHILVGAGISKLRITGGEPFVRNGILDFMDRLGGLPGLESLHVTTNGTLTEGLIPDLVRMKVKSVNLSLDSLDPIRFREITRRDAFDRVRHTLDALLESPIEVKINMVIMGGRNIEDIGPMTELTRNHLVAVRLIEEMPFNGTGLRASPEWSATRILDHLRSLYPQITAAPAPPFSTSSNYHIPGFVGQVGIIAAYSRTFCGSCNRIRITPQGELRTCLYGDPVLNFRTLLRNGASDNHIDRALRKVLSQRFADGFKAQEARQNPESVGESMATIGG